MPYFSKLFTILTIVTALCTSATAADTTMVYAEQLNHYYQFGAQNRFSQEFGKIFVYNYISNASSIYSETSKLKSQGEINGDVLFAFTEKFRFGATGRYFSFSDGQTSHAYDYDQARIGLKADIKSKNYKLVLQSGYAGETRLGIRDMGTYAGLTLNRSETNPTIDPYLNWDYSQMGDRKNYTFNNKIVL